MTALELEKQKEAINGINEQVRELRNCADASIFSPSTKNLFSKAAYTIEFLSSKLDAVNRGRSDGWIPCRERLPEENGTDSYDMQLVTLDNGNVCLGVYRHCDKEWLVRMSEGEQFYSNKHKVLAWCPLPEPYRDEDSMGGDKHD